MIEKNITDMIHSDQWHLTDFFDLNAKWHLHNDLVFKIKCHETFSMQKSQIPARHLMSVNNNSMINIVVTLFWRNVASPNEHICLFWLLVSVTNREWQVCTAIAPVLHVDNMEIFKQYFAKHSNLTYIFIWQQCWSIKSQITGYPSDSWSY